MNTTPTTHIHRSNWRARFAAPAAMALALVALALPTASSAQSIAFSDPLTGPTSPNLSIPSDYSYTAQGLQRTGGAVYRSLVKTASGAYLTAAQFTAEVSVNVAFGDIAFIGLGQGALDPNYGPNEPSNGFVFRIHNLSGYSQIDTAAVTLASSNSGNHYLQVGGISNYSPGSTTVFRIVRDGDNVTLSVPSQNASRTYSIAQYNAKVGLTNANTYVFFGSGNTGTRFANLAITRPVSVFASGISPVIAWDPIFPPSAYPNAAALSTPVPLVGYNANWVNPHPASVFPKGTHPWENIVPYNFDANWINAWSNISSQGPAGQSWTKYSTTITGQGDFVLQFLADNASWVYIDGNLVGYQDWNWQTNGTGRYTIHLTGAGSHELSFIIWDGGGAAGGKFRLETTQSFLDNGGGTLPPSPDTTPPVITAPGNITAEATGPSGKAVTFTATAVDNVDGAVNVIASPASGSTFPLGTTTVGLAASDAAHNTASASFTVTVQDTTPPGLLVPGSVVAEATSASGATVTYASATASDAVGVASVTYSKNSGTQFPLGVTTVNVTATDTSNNATTLSFTVTVQDTTAPVIAPVSNQTLEATSAAGAVATYSASATDAVGVASLTYSAASGSTFAIGSTPVTVTAKDAAGNTSTSTFTITVKDTTAPVITVPANQILEATSAVGAVATYSASATDAVGVASLTYSAASGSTFAIGTTTVTVTAKDAAGNTSTGTFTVKVQDTTAPVITAPANQTLEATSAAGAVATFAGSATDAVGVTSLTYSPASGTTFALGTTTVTVTARDAAGNTSTATFTITVRDTTAPVISSLTTNAPNLWPPNHKMVAVAVSPTATDAVGVASLKIISVTSSEPDNGLGDGDTAGDIEITGALTVNLRAERSGTGNGRTYTIVVEAKDAAGNATTKTVTVLVPKSQGGK